MKDKKYIFLLFTIVLVSKNFAQQTTNLNIKDAIEIVLTKSYESKLANTKTITKRLDFESSKNSQYPDIKLSGQLLRLNDAAIDLKNTKSSATGQEAVNQLILAQANASLPLFSGFKIQNNIALKENLYQAELAKSANTKEELAIKVVEYYARLYQAQKSVLLITENLKVAHQRVLDFIDLEKNGIIARNDLLKAKLQESKTELSLAEAKKNVAVLNYYLITILQLPDNYNIGIDENQFGCDMVLRTADNIDEALKNRKDLSALKSIESVNQNEIKIARSAYFPTVSLVGGYTTLSLQNVATVTNALNIGLGFNYNLSSLYKNSKEVKIAQSKAEEIKETKEILTENIKFQVKQTVENFKLSLKQNLVYIDVIAQATENYRIIKDKYDNGLSTTNELFEADAEQLNAKINQANSKANVMLKYYQMLEASGILTASFNFKKQ
jgi:outer membrane protein